MNAFLPNSKPLSRTMSKSRPKWLSLLVTAIIFLGVMVPGRGLAAGQDFRPNTQNNFTGAATYCQNSSASNLSFIYNTASCGSGSNNGIALTVNWYYNTTNSTSVGTATLVSTTTPNSSTSATGTLTYTPLTTTVGTFYYFVVISWSAGPNCGVAGSLTSATTQLVTVNALPVTTVVSGGGTFCGSTTINANNGSDGTIYFQGTTSNGTSTGTPSTSQLITTSGTYYFRARSAAGCWGAQGSSVVTIDPVPVVTTAATKATCSGTGPNIALTASVASSFSWTVGTITGGITGASAGSGSTINQVLTNPSNTTAGTVEYLVTPTSTTGSCVGNPYTITVTVNPSPAVTTASTASTCSGTGPAISLTASVASSFTWTVGTITGGITGASNSSGSTINQSLTNPGNATAGSVVYNVVPTATTGACVGAGYPITVTVNPKPAVTTSTTASICNLTGPNISLAASAPSSFSWTIGSITGSISGASAGSGSTINQTLTNPSGSTSGTVQYLVTPTSTTGSCVGSTTTITVAVTPTPVVTTASTKAICSGAGTNISLTSSAASSFSWTIGTITGGITGASAGSGSTINQTLANPSNTTAGTVEYIVTPTSTTNSCVGNPYTITVTVNPSPAVTTASTASTCSGTGPAISLTASVASSFAWTIGTITGGITGAGNSSGTTINQTLTNPSNATAGSVVYNVVPTATTGSCVGAGYPITVTVNPKPAVTTSTTASICNLTGPNISLVASAPSSFSWTIGSITGSISGASAGSGSTINQTLTNPSGSTSGTVQYLVTPTSTTGSCVGSATTITVTVTPTPAVTNASTKAICSGAGTNISLTSSAASSFSWTIGTITGGITGVSAGSGSTINQTLTNPSNTTAGTVEYLVTPTSTTGSCVGNPYTITVTVNPTPVVTTPATDATCSGTSPGIALTASAASSFAWTLGTNTGSITGMSAASGSTINQTLTNPSNSSAGSIVYNVTPTATTGGCVGPVYPITVTVNPKPVVTNASTASTCSGTGPGIALTSSAPGSFAWTIGTIVGGITGASASSGGTINQSLTNPSSTTNGSVQYLVIPTATTGSCAGTAFTITVTVTPTPVVTTAATKATCSGTGPNIALTASVASSFSWTVGTITGGITGASAGSGSTINQVLTNPSNTTAGTVEYLVTPASTTGSCVGNPYTITVTVNPSPAVTTASTASTCSGTGPAISLTASVASSFTWTVGTITGGITGASNSSGSTINQSLTNPGNATAGSVVYNVVPTATTGACVGASYPITVTVNPKPVMTSPASASICNGGTLNVPLTSSAGSSYTWIAADNPNTTGESTSLQNTSTLNDIITNNTASFKDVIYSVTPTSVPEGCVGPTQTVTVSVFIPPVITAEPALKQTVCATFPVSFHVDATGDGLTYQWYKGATALSDIGFITGSKTSTLMIDPTALSDDGFYHVVVSGTAPCTAATSINAELQVDEEIVISQQPFASQTFCAGETATFTVASTGSNLTYQWRKGAADLVDGGDISGATTPTLTLSNITAADATTAATRYSVVITDAAAVGNCNIAFSNPAALVVNPVPTVDPVANLVRCNNASASVVFTGAVAGTVYNWTNDNPSIGLASSGSGNIGAFNVSNSSAAPITATITVTPTYTAAGKTCTGSFKTFTITVNPTATVNPVSNQVRCNGSATATASFTGSPVAGTVYNWTNTATSIGLAASGTGDIPSFTATNTGTTVVTATIQVTPIANGCPGTPISFTITVNPTTSFTAPADLVRCNGASTGAISFTGATVIGTTYSWTNDLTSIGLAATGSGNIAAFNAVNSGTSPVTATINVTPSANGCPGNAQSFTILVNPTPTVNAIPNQDVCNGFPTNAINFGGSAVAGTVYNWTNNTTSIGLPASGNTDIASFTAVNTGATTNIVTATITVSPTAAGCQSSKTFTIAVSATPTTANAGTDITSNCTSSVTLNGNAPAANHGTGAWSIISGSGGTITNPTLRNSTFTTTSPNPVTYTLRWTISNGACASSFDDVDVTFYPKLTNLDLFFASICRDAVTGIVTPIINPLPPGATGGNGTYTYSWTRSCNGASAYVPIPGETGSSLLIQPNTNCFYVRTVTSGTCKDSSQKVHVNVNNIPSTFYQVTPNGPVSYCAGGSGIAVGIDGSILGTVDYSATYQLYLNNVAIGAPQPGTGGPLSFGLQTAAGTYTVRESVTLTSGSQTCGTSLLPNSTTISIDANVTPSNAGTAQIVCNSATLNGNTPSIGTGTWSLISGAGTITSVINPSTTVTNLGTGANIFKWKITNGACADSSNVTITASQPSVAPTTLTATPATICNGGSTTLTQNGGVLGTNAKWQWYADAGYTIKVGGLLSTVNASLPVSPTTTSTYYLRAEISPATPCPTNTPAPVSVTVTVNQPSVAPTNVAASPAVICNGDATTLTQTGGVLGTGAFWQWYSNAGFTVPIGGPLTTSNASLIVSPSANTTYYIRAEGGTSPCSILTSNGVNTTVVVNQPNVIPTSLNASSPTICDGGNTLLTQVGGVLGTGAYWQWYSDAGYTTPVGGPLITANASISVSPTFSATYYLRMEGNASLCASNTNAGNITVNVNPRPTSVISGTAPICFGGSTTISIQFTGNSPWNLTLSNGTVLSGITTNPYTFSVSPNSNTSYIVTALSDANCTSLAGDRTGTATVTVNPLPTISGTLSVCDAGSTTTLTGSGIPDATSPWVSSNTAAATISNTGVVTGVSAGTTVITYTNNNGCKQTATVTVNAKPVIANQSAISTCSGSASLSPVIAGAPLGTTYSWGTPVMTGSMTGGSTGVNQAFTTGTFTNSGTAIETATYTITPRSAAGCFGTPFSVIVNVNPVIAGTAVWLGTTSTDWCTASNWSCGVIPSSSVSAIIPAGSFRMPDINCDATVLNLTVEAGATLNLMAAGTLNIFGNFTNTDPTRYTLAGTVNFTGGFGGLGNPSQTIPSFTYNNLTVTGNGSTKTLAGPVTVNGSLTLTGGLIISSTTNMLTISTTGSVTAGSDQSYIQGPLTRETNQPVTYFFPVGGGGVIRVASVTPEDYTLSSYTVYYQTPTPVGSMGGSDLFGTQTGEYWDVTKNYGVNAIPGFYYKNPNNLTYGAATTDWTTGVNPCVFCNVAVTELMGSTWYYTGGIGQVGFAPTESTYWQSNSFVDGRVPITDNGVSHQYSFGYGYAIILPVKLVSFTGTRQANNNLLEWKFANTVDLAATELQYSRDGLHFVNLASINATSADQYQFLHRNLQPGAHYYRLLIKEKTGKTGFSQTILLVLGKDITLIRNLRPNPVEKETWLEIHSAGNQNAKAVLLDLTGRTLANYKLNLQQGENKIRINADMLVQGMYLMRVETDDGARDILRFVKK